MGELGVPKVAAKPVTETAPFELRIDKRAAIRPVTDADGMLDVVCWYQYAVITHLLTYPISHLLMAYS